MTPQYGINPISGEKMDSKALFKLNFHKNADGKYHCPVMYRVFTDTSAIVAIKVITCCCKNSLTCINSGFSFHS
jgi:hypothetical protein